MSTVSRWCRDIEPPPGPRVRTGRRCATHPARTEAALDTARALHDARELVGRMSDRDLLFYGIGLYHGEGAKSQGVRMANTSPAVLLAFVTWLRRFFDIDEQRLRARLSLHSGQDLEAATIFWSELLDIPPTAFQAPHRPDPRPGQIDKHPHGCASVIYSSAPLHRRVMALIEAVSSSVADPG